MLLYPGFQRLAIPGCCVGGAPRCGHRDAGRHLVELRDDFRELRDDQRIGRGGARRERVAVGLASATVDIDILSVVVGGERRDAEAVGKRQNVVLRWAGERPAALRNVAATEVVLPDASADAVAGF